MIFLFIFYFYSFLFVVESNWFYPCACCTIEYNFCVHNASNISTDTLDTSTYCCIPKSLARISIKKDNVSLYNRHCTERRLHQKHIVLFATIISSYEPLSKRCYDRKKAMSRSYLPSSTKSDTDQSEIIFSSSSDRQTTDEIKQSAEEIHGEVYEENEN